VNFLGRLAGAYVDAVLNTFYPLEKERSMADLEREEVSTGGRVGPEDVWPEQPDPIDHMIALLEDIRNLVSSAVSPEAAERPDSVEQPAESGHPNLRDDLIHAAGLLEDSASDLVSEGLLSPNGGRERVFLAGRLKDAAKEMK
jgi:hypothetical protein